jgi:hypothetical protein
MHNFNKYLTPSPVDEKWGFFITSVGYSKIDINQAYPINIRSIRQRILLPGTKGGSWTIITLFTSQRGKALLNRLKPVHLK